jgi:hypothetical protein
MFPPLEKKAESVNFSDTTSNPLVEKPLLPKNILPVIQPFDWAGKDKSLKRSLCYLPQQTGTPWLSFSFEADSLSTYANETSLETWGVSAGELETIALQNLCDLPAEWQTIKLTPRDARPIKALLCQSQSRIAERVLDRALLQHAHDLLQDETPVAILPDRSTLIVMPLAGDLPFRVASQFYNNSYHALTDWVFCIARGTITGRVTFENGRTVFDTVVTV